MVHLEKAIQEFSLKWPFILGILEEFLWGLISIEGAGCISVCLSFWWKWAPLWVCLKS